MTLNERIEIANKLGVTSGAIGASLKSLQNKTIINVAKMTLDIIQLAKHFQEKCKLNP